MKTITSRDNAQYKELLKLAGSSQARRKSGRTLLDGVHLCQSYLQLRGMPEQCIVSESALQNPEVADIVGQLESQRAHVLGLPDALYNAVSQVEHGVGVMFLIETPERAVTQPLSVSAVLLDNLQDPGNVGSILRSASAFGFRQVAAIKGSAALWSPKVLRAGMGAHFALDLIEGLALDDLAALQVPLLVTSSHAGDFLHRAALPWPCAWVMGHEGQGVSPALEDRAALRIRIAQPGGEESLNVAAAAAICLHASGAGR